MALTPTQESVAIAVGNAFIAAGFTTDASNTLDNFTIYARGTGGEYSALDLYSGA
jgi:hypothetical protein